VALAEYADAWALTWEKCKPVYRHK
jgi:hypothetical protein